MSKEKIIEDFLHIEFIASHLRELPDRDGFIDAWPKEGHFIRLIDMIEFYSKPEDIMIDEKGRVWKIG